MKKTILIPLILILSLSPVLSSASCAADDGTVLAFTSDVHNGTDNIAAERLSFWIDSVMKSKGHIDYMGFCGDMGDDGVEGGEYQKCALAVMDTVSGKGLDACYTTGNHEFYNGSFDSADASFKGLFVKDTETADETNYRLYCIGTDNWDNRDDNYTNAQIEKLTGYLDSVDGSKPIIIMTHFPLHACASSDVLIRSRETVNAGIVIDALNAAAAAGKTIVLLWGHNHSLSDPCYDTLFSPGDIISYTLSGDAKTLGFYYAAAGCMSDSEYDNGSHSVKGKGLVIGISADSKLSFTYFDIDGNPFSPLEPIRTESEAENNCIVSITYIYGLFRDILTGIAQRYSR